MDRILRVQGTFKCPECSYQDANPHNFHCHPHIQAIKKAAEAAEKPSLKTLCTHHSNLSRVSIPSPHTSAPSTPHNPAIALPTGPPSNHVSPAVQQSPLQPEDQQDADYQSMETEQLDGTLYFEARALIQPEEFRTLQLGIDPDHKLLVCQSCHHAVQQPGLRNHIRQLHGGATSIPPDLDLILDSFNVPPHINPPPNKISPIKSIYMYKGFMCQAHGCGFAGKNHHSFISNHSRPQHPDLPVDKHVIPSMVQVVFPGCDGHQVWAVDPALTAAPTDDVAYRRYIQKVQQLDASGWDDGTIRRPEDSHHISGFLREFGWLRITEGHNYRELCKLVEAPTTSNPSLLPLKQRVSNYFARTWPIMEGMSSLVLCWITTSEG